MKQIFFTAVMFMGLINLLRIALYLVMSEIHEIHEHKQRKQPVGARYMQPWISVIIPAYNEECSIRGTVLSVLSSDYPHYEVIVVDDGSHDKTSQIVRSIIRENPKARLRLVRQQNAGKSHALNRAITLHARGSLVMCLDADSRLAPEALTNAVSHFQRDRRLLALASNMKIESSKSVISLAQKIEYIVANRFKRSLSVLRTEYIIGGIGSTFRKSYLKRIGNYDTDTMTEDIDLTMKLIRYYGNMQYRVGYGYDVHTYTQAVPNFRDLIKQRFRWKFGRMQTFYKNRELFFNRSGKYSKLLTFFQLPYALYGDISLTIEPLLFLYILINIIVFWNPYILVWGVLFMMAYVGWIIMTSNDDNLTAGSRLRLVLLTPFSWFLFYVITAVEFVAFIKCLAKLPTLSSSLSGKAASWAHVKRVTA
jgi:cellulose synthase/poly-beta-1,6-N-acetylglucosamine synthase-like glycosyltransferase